MWRVGRSFGFAGRAMGGCPAWRCGALILIAVVLGSVATVARAANPIVVENSKPGDTAWEGAVTAHVNYIHPPIDGYASATSVRPGGTIDFYVTEPNPGRYRIEIVRLGWYGGKGGRRLTCLVGSTLDPTCTKDEPGIVQPAAPAPNRVTGEIDAGWRVTDRLTVPTNWVTGYYLAIWVRTAGSEVGQTGFTPFIVQAPPGDHSQILVQVPSNTWEAYNTWGGEDLYSNPEAVKVSFNRPFQHHLLFYWEYPLVRFLERNGYDVSYATDDDVDRDPGILLDHKLDMTAGHGEYWTHRERDGWQAARAHGVNLAFMGANTGYWQVRYEDNDRTMVSYKYFHDPERNPALKSTRFRDLKPPRPECELLGEQYNTDGTSSEDGHYFNFRVTAAGANDPWFAGTGLHAGSVLKGFAGFEFDSIAPACQVPPVTVLLHFHSAPYTADSVRYRACSGSEVFDAGSLFFSWGLDSFRDPDYSPPLWPDPPPVSPALQRFMENAIGDMLVAHPRFRALSAIRVIRHGTELRIAPDVSDGIVSVSATAVDYSRGGRVAYRSIGGARHPRSVLWRLAVPRSAVAVLVDVSVRTGDVRDTREYVLLTNRRGGVGGPAGQVSSTSCYGSQARVLTPVFGGPRSSRLRVALNMPRPLTVTIRRGREVVSVNHVRRGRGSADVSVPAAAIPVGRVTVVLTAHHLRFRLGAVRVGNLDSDDNR
jgi:hypothetical protein